MSNTVSTSMSNFQLIASKFSPRRSVMVTGRPGIGKSESVAQIGTKIRSEFYASQENCTRASDDLVKEASVVRRMAKFWAKNPVTEEADKYAAYRPSKEHPHGIWHYDMGVPIVERRLSQLTEGDVTGLPGRGKYGTVFQPCEWLFYTVHYPCVLFLDELNRALKPVEQATFQLADSRVFYGNALHAESRLFIACNVGDQYDVSPMDPAAVSRYAMFELDPTVKDWLAWAKEELDPAVVDFIFNNEKFLEHKGVFEANKKTPDRRAWTAVDMECRYGGYYENHADPLFIPMVASLVGIEAAVAFHKFLVARGSQITLDEVFENWTKAKARLPKDDDKRTMKLMELTDKMKDFLDKKNFPSPAAAKNAAAFLKDAGSESLYTVWQTCNKRLENMRMITPYVSNDLMNVLKNDKKPAPVPDPQKK